MAVIGGHGLRPRAFVLYCIVCLFNVSFYNSGCSLIQTNIKQFLGLHKAFYLLHKEHAEPSFKSGFFELFSILGCFKFIRKRIHQEVVANILNITCQPFWIPHGLCVE